jgi:hypothetical protein
LDFELVTSHMLPDLNTCIITKEKVLYEGCHTSWFYIRRGLVARE